MVYTAKVLNVLKAEDEKCGDVGQQEKMDDYSVVKYPFSVKMMFNYDIQSNATAILRAMYREIVPARNSNIGTSDWQIE